MVVILRDGTSHILPEERRKAIFEAVNSNKFMIDLYGDTKTAIVSTTAIAEILSDEQYDETYRAAKGEVKCRFGYWHGKGESCGHVDPVEEPLDLSYLRENRPKMPVTEVGDAWFRLMKVNNDLLKSTGKFGSLRTLAELDEYEKTSTMPLPVERLGNAKVAVEFRWVRKVVTEKQFSRDYSGRPGYAILGPEGSDMVIAYKKPLTGSHALKYGEDWCNDQEVERLERSNHRKAEINADFYSDEQMALRREENRKKYAPQWQREQAERQERIAAKAEVAA